jgi:hypothetical protein
MTTPQDETLNDLIAHPELTPIVDIDSRGNVVCFGWVSPIYTFDKDFLEDDI